jgi:predicted metal-dependent hydrolase
LHFNLLLAAAPPEVIDYVIIHELVHLIEFDHSSQFWQLVKEADPDYKKHIEWLGNYASVIKVV